jgi:fucose 4-O-acetylase-like acetyltransferase
MGIMRNVLVDSIKGWAVLLVILGHAIQRTFPDYSNNMLFNMIYSFHMPLFMLLSGYILYFSKKNIDLCWLGDRFRRLILPFFAWYIIDWFASRFSFTGLRPHLDFSGTFTEYIIRGITTPANGPWFLWAMFICSIAFYFSHKLMPRFGVFYAMIIVYFLSRLVPIHNYGISYMKTMFPFFSFGYMLPHYKARLTKYHKPFLILSLIVFPILSVNWFVLPNLIQYFRFAKSVLVIVIPLMGALLSYHLIKLLQNTRVFSVIAYLGTLSLEFYVCQGLFLNVGIGNGYLRVATIAIAATLLSYLLIFIAQKINLLQYILFGRNRLRALPTLEILAETTSK